MKNRDQGTESIDQGRNGMELMLRDALPPLKDEPESYRDLWPALLRRMDEQASRGAASVPWFDWALGGALLAFAAVVPRAIPVMLYYL